VWHIAYVEGQREKGREREAWRRIRWQTTHLINISGKSIKHEMQPGQLFKLDDEIEPPLPPEERERRTRDNLGFHKKKAWMKLRHDRDGNVKIFDEEDYKRVKAKK